MSDDIEDRRDDDGGDGGWMPGGFGGFRLGLGGILVLGILSLVTRRDLLTPFLGMAPARAPVTHRESAQQKAAEQPMVEFVSFVLDDLQRTWTKELPQYGAHYRKAKLVLFHDVVNSPCGTTDSATGPFYCPGDAKVYIDLSFYRELKERFGAPGEFAQAYVIAHEIGHHVQNLLGTEAKVQAARRRDPANANRLSVATELQADCYAGVWGHSTEQRSIIDQSDVRDGLNAASAIGDDRLQSMATGRVMPERFTHGSSAQRVRWFRKGLESGDLRGCDTFRELMP